MTREHVILARENGPEVFFSPPKTVQLCVGMP